MIRDVPRRVGIVAVAAMAGCATVAEPSPASPPAAVSSAPAGTPAPARAVSAEQAERGRLAFRESCGECHGSNEFRGGDFLFRWGRRTAWDFFSNVRRNMPESLPGSLPDEVYVDVVAYVLTLNGYARDGDDIVPTEAALDRLPMDGAQAPGSGPQGSR